ncbi:hypothetical protein CLG85_012210 [Yangia mangrovi]|uniref:Uncharacterized protein n=1 Tax=Alloyangia mangrovi TaxID=1779329 RepID=A0ABT2KL12_9RHOB|nr:hypothetical protein [Alloyangia mangrovi]MCT4371039.1 hypothetical protein [Alloyangia mangrovi]
MTDRGKIDTGLTLSALDILQAVKKKSLVSLFAGLVVGGVAYLVLLPMPPIYSATSIVWFDEREERLLTSDSAFSALADDTKVTWVNEVAPIVKEAAIIQSVPVLTRVVNDLDLVQQPETLRSNRVLLKETLKDRIKAVLPAALFAGNDEDIPVTPSGGTAADTPLEVIQQLAAVIKTNTNELTQLISITVSSPDPQAAARIANHLPEAFLLEHNGRVNAASAEMVGWLEAQLQGIRTRIQSEETDLSSNAVALRQMTHDADVGLYRDLLKRRNEVQQLQNIQSHPIRVVSRATVPTEPAAAGPVRFALAALVATFIAASLVFALRELLNKKLRYPRQFDELGLHVLAAAPDRGRSRPLFDESIRRLLSLVVVDLRRGPVAIGFTSGAAQEGKTLVAREFARAAARSGLRTVLIEADLRHPQSRATAAPEQPGLADLLASGRGPDAYFVEERGEGAQPLYILPSVEASRSPTEMLASLHMTQLLTRLRETFDLVVCDMPPVCMTADAEALAPQLDGTVLVVRHGHAGLARTKSAVALLERGGDHLIGAFVNDCPPQFLSELYGRGPLDYGVTPGRDAAPAEGGAAQEGRRVNAGSKIKLLPLNRDMRSDVG